MLEGKNAVAECNRGDRVELSGSRGAGGAVVLYSFLDCVLCLCLCVHEYKSLDGDQKMTSGPLEMLLGTVAGQGTWLLRTELRPSGRAACSLRGFLRDN